MDTVIYQGTLTKARATIGQTAMTWSDVEGVLPPTEETSIDPNDYYFVLNGTRYDCNDFLKGTTKFKASYKVSGHDGIMLEYLVATDLSNIKIRTDDGLNVIDGDNEFALYCISHEPSDKKMGAINFGKQTVIVSFENGEAECEVIEND